MLDESVLASQIMKYFKDEMPHWDNGSNSQGVEAMAKLTRAIAKALVEHIKQSDITIDGNAFAFTSPQGPCTPINPIVKASIA